MFEEMSIAEDCYCVGTTSRLVATELASLQANRSKRSVNYYLLSIFTTLTIIEFCIFVLLIDNSMCHINRLQNKERLLY